MPPLNILLLSGSNLVSPKGMTFLELRKKQPNFQNDTHAFFFEVIHQVLNGFHGHQGQ